MVRIGPLRSLRQRLRRPLQQIRAKCLGRGVFFLRQHATASEIGRGEREGRWAELSVHVRGDLAVANLGGKAGAFRGEGMAAPHLNGNRAFTVSCREPEPLVCTIPGESTFNLPRRGMNYVRGDETSAKRTFVGEV